MDPMDSTCPTDPASRDCAPIVDAGQQLAVARRRLLRRGAVLAGAAGVAAATSVTGAPPARAADGDPVIAGRTTTAATRTSLSIAATPGRSQPTLSLGNASGAALELRPLPESWNGPLAIGQIASLATGPVVGVDHGDGVRNAYIALSLDLDALSLPVAIAPQRILDTRSITGRSGILSSSSTSAFDAGGRLRAGQWLDLSLAPTDQATIDAVFANITITSPLSGGYLTVYPGGSRPTASSINYVTGQTVANAGMFAAGISAGHYIIRIYTSATTHILLDVTGFTGPATSPSAQPRTASERVSRAALQRSTSRRSAARRTIRAMGRR